MAALVLRACISAVLSSLISLTAQAFELEQTYYCETADWRALAPGSDRQFETVENFAAPERFTIDFWQDDARQATALITGRQIAIAKGFQGIFAEGHFAAPEYGQVFIDHNKDLVFWSYWENHSVIPNHISLQLVAQCATTWKN